MTNPRSLFSGLRVATTWLALCAMSTALSAQVKLTTLVLPERKTLTVTFVPTKRAPAKATMEAALRYEKGQAAIDLKFDKMEPAVLFGGDISAYVLWAVTSDGLAENLGEVLVDRRDCSAAQSYSTGKKIFALMVTGEPLAVATQPTEVVLFTSGPAASKAAGNTPFTFSGFGSGAKPGVESIAGIQYNDEAPVAVKQAQKALEIADGLKAGDVNPVAMRDANTAFVKANSTAKAGGSQKVITDYARRAVELASQAIRDTNRANAARAAVDAESRRAEEKSNLEKRAATAENDAERTAALLKEVEAQRAALATDSKNLALERDKFAAERDAVKADLARVEAERAAVEKERDGLEKMLKESLSSVAETNETARGVIVSLSGILFDLGKATLQPSAQLSVAKLAGILTVFQNMNLSIEGYTDTSGTDEVNMKLSNDRARTVYDFLQAQGIAAGRMKYQGFGPANPVAPNDTEANRAKNRRVEVVLTQAPKQE